MAAAAACPVALPLLPTPPPSSRPPERTSWSDAKPGRASASRNWGTDKLLARVSAGVPGRASLSADWKLDKTEHSKVKGESRRSDRKRSPSREPADRSEKKAKVYYAGPAFIKSPEPSELPFPRFLIKAPDAPNGSSD